MQPTTTIEALMILYGSVKRRGFLSSRPGDKSVWHSMPAAKRIRHAAVR